MRFGDVAYVLTDCTPRYVGWNSIQQRGSATLAYILSDCGNAASMPFWQGGKVWLTLTYVLSDHEKLIVRKESGHRG